MTQRQQAVKSVFAIEEVIRPVAVEAAVGVPEGIYEIQTALGFPSC